MPTTISPDSIDGLLGYKTTQIALGDEGKRVDQEAEAAADHWLKLPSFLMESEDDEDYSYTPIPIKIIGEIDVTFEYIGRIKPLPFPAD